MGFTPAQLNLGQPSEYAAKYFLKDTSGIRENCHVPAQPHCIKITQWQTVSMLGSLALARLVRCMRGVWGALTGGEMDAVKERWCQWRSWSFEKLKKKETPEKTPQI